MKRAGKSGLEPDLPVSLKRTTVTDLFKIVYFVYLLISAYVPGGTQDREW